jgi:hypothetical protein
VEHRERAFGQVAGTAGSPAPRRTQARAQAAHELVKAILSAYTVCGDGIDRITATCAKHGAAENPRRFFDGPDFGSSWEDFFSEEDE